MPDVNRHTTQRNRSAIYKLKRLYGGTIFLYKQGNPSTDLLTGVKTWSDREVYRIEYAIILPVKATREQVQTISMISADKKFVYGGYFDRHARWFFIDPRDLPSGYVIEQDDHIVYRGKQYEIKEILDTEFDSIWGVSAVALEGVVPQQMHNLSGKNILDFQFAASGVK